MVAGRALSNRMNQLFSKALAPPRLPHTKQMVYSYFSTCKLNLVWYPDPIFAAADGLHEKWVWGYWLRSSRSTFVRTIKMQCSVTSHLVINYLKRKAVSLVIVVTA